MPVFPWRPQQGTFQIIPVAGTNPVLYQIVPTTHSNARQSLGRSAGGADTAASSVQFNSLDAYDPYSHKNDADYDADADDDDQEGLFDKIMNDMAKVTDWLMGSLGFGSEARSNSEALLHRFEDPYQTNFVSSEYDESYADPYYDRSTGELTSYYNGGDNDEYYQQEASQQEYYHQQQQDQGYYSYEQQQQQTPENEVSYEAESLVTFVQPPENLKPEEDVQIVVAESTAAATAATSPPPKATESTAAEAAEAAEATFEPMRLQKLQNPLEMQKEDMEEAASSLIEVS